MDRLDLALFLAIARRGSLTAAARDLALSTAAASQRLRVMERAIGVRLFQRSTRRVVLTPDGATFLPYAEDALTALDEGMAQVGGGSLAPRGHLRLTAPGSFGRMHLVPALAAFVEHYPQIALDVRLSDEIVDLVEGAFDLAIRHARLTDSTLVARHLADVELGLVASPGYRDRHGLPASPDDLSTHHAVVLGSQDLWTLKRDSDVKAVSLNPRLRLNDGEAVRQASEAGVGIALCATWNMQEAVRSGRLVRVLPDWTAADPPAIWAVYPAGRFVAPKVRAMIDFLAARFSPRAPWMT